MFEEVIGFEADKSYNVHVNFNLSYSAADSDVAPYVGSKDVTLYGSKKNMTRQDVIEQLEETLRNFFAGINEFPREIVHVKVTDFYM